jgi:hypothetical protein
MFVQFRFVQTLIKFTGVTAKIVRTDFVVNPPRKHVTTLTLIPVPQPHPVSPTLLHLLLYLRTCLFEGPGHVRIKWAVRTIECIVAKPEVDHPCFHPDALLFQDIETLNPFGLTNYFFWLSHICTSSLGFILRRWALVAASSISSSRPRHGRHQAEVIDKKVSHVLVKLTSFALQSSGAASAADEASLRPNAVWHPGFLFLNSLGSLGGIHGQLLSIIVLYLISRAIRVPAFCGRIFYLYNTKIYILFWKRDQK